MDNSAVLTIDQEGLDVIVRLGGEIDLSNSAEVRDCLVTFSDRTVIADCSRVTFMDVTALSSLIVAQQRIREDGGKFILYGVQAAQVRVLEIAKLTGYFDCMVPD
jgi:anti-anti-sigma factor